MSNRSISKQMARLRSRSYWREADGRVAVDAWRGSGLTLAGFARQHGLSAQRVRWWRDRLDGDASFAPLSPATIVPVTVVETAPRTSSPASMMEVVLASGHIVRVGVDFDAAALEKLVRTLEASC